MIIPDSSLQFAASQNNWLLSIYAQQMGYLEIPFWGLNKPGLENECTQILTKTNRDRVLFALLEAQQKIENFLLAPIYPRWITDERHYIKKSGLVKTNWMFLQDIGEKISSSVSSEILDFSSDPASLEIVTDKPLEAIEFYFEDTQVRVFPSKVTPTLTGFEFFFPWARLIQPELSSNPEDGWDYQPDYMDSVYVESLDWVTVEAGGSSVSHLYRACQSCAFEETEATCAEIHNEFGYIIIKNTDPDYKKTPLIKVNYKAWLEPNNIILEALVSLTNSYMPTEFTTCDQMRYRWEKDRLPATQPNPFGETSGALHAWNILQNEKRMRSSLI